MSFPAGDALPPSAPPPLPPPKSTSLEQRVYYKHGPSVVQVVAGKLGWGSGFVVHKDGTSCLILTCAHVFASTEPCDPRNLQVTVRFKGLDDDVPARVVQITELRDLALLRVLGIVPDCTPLEFSDEVDLSRREVVEIGFLGVDQASVCIEPATPRGTILSEPVLAPRESEFFEYIVCNHSSSQGMSGGPIIMEDKVVGVGFRFDAGLSIAITVATVKSVLKGWTGRGEDQDITIKEMLRLIADEEIAGEEDADEEDA